MKNEKYFPRGMAEGRLFCNRKEERSRIVKNIKECQHTLIMSPRRYGKTSLVFYSLKEMGIPFGDADLFISVDAKNIEYLVLEGIKKVISHVGTPLDHVLDFFKNYFRDKHSQWTVGTKGVNLALIPSIDSNPAINILEALEALENLLEEKEQQAVLFLDEMQEIGEIAEGSGIEGAIRHVAQKSNYLSFIFSGSNRHLLSKMFYDRSRPLYKLCDRITLTRIHSDEYKLHMDIFSKERWSSTLRDDTFNEICNLTELHPYYVNSLCANLWDNKDIPLPSDVLESWNEIIKEEKSEILSELSSISLGQKKILSLIARGQKSALSSKKSLQILDMTSSSVVESISILERKDYIEQLENNEYRILDPLLKFVLSRSI